jgi:hypothetical protein
VPAKLTRESVGLPERPFLYTLDQISAMIEVTVKNLKISYCYFEGRSTGMYHADMMRTHDIAPPKEKPDWRVEERELIRWMRRKGFRAYVT